MVLGMELQRPNLLGFVDFSLLDWKAGSGTDQITCKWLTLWNPDVWYFVRWQMREKVKNEFKQLYCLEVLLLLLLYRSWMKCVMWCDAMPVKQTSEWDWEGSKAIEPGLEKSRRSPEEHGAVEGLSWDLAGAGSEEGWCVTSEERVARWITV